jgi:integrase
MPKTKEQSNRRRTDGEGTYYREAHRYCWKLRMGSREHERPIVRKRNTAAELKIAVREVLAKLEETGERIPKGTEMTVTQAMTRWNEDRIKLNREETTYNKYRSLIKNYIAPSIGSLKVSKVDDAAVQKLTAYVLTRVRTGKGGKPIERPDGSPWHLSADTALSAVRCLCTGLKLSIKSLKADGLELPDSIERDRVLDEDEISDFLAEALKVDDMKTRPGETMRRYRDGILLAFVLNTGLRISEALGIVTMMVSLREGTLTVSQQLKRGHDAKGNPTWSLGATKNKTTRVLPLNGQALELIRMQLKAQAEDKAVAGDGYEDKGLLFATESGKPHRERNVLRSLDSICAAAGISKCTIHDCRRSYITHLAGAEDNISTVSQIAGHNGPKTTQKHYIVPQQRRMREATDKVGFGMVKAG